jgi:hypothetical protein
MGEEATMLRVNPTIRNGLTSLALLAFPPLETQAAGPELPEVRPVSVSASPEKLEGKAAIRVTKDPAVKAFDEPTFARLVGKDFKDGTIEVKVLSRLQKDAPEFARGFIGVAFRINEDNSKFECIYLRPTNARAEQQLRRNRSVQYFAYPDFKFERLRKEAPGEYESYVDMGMNEWIDLRIEVKGARAKLFVNGQKEPTLVVNDLKLGPDASGAIGLWVDVGTEGHFSDVRVRND